MGILNQTPTEEVLDAAPVNRDEAVSQLKAMRHIGEFLSTGRRPETTLFNVPPHIRSQLKVVASPMDLPPNVIIKDPSSPVLKDIDGGIHNGSYWLDYSKYMPNDPDRIQDPWSRWNPTPIQGGDLEAHRGQMQYQANMAKARDVDHSQSGYVTGTHTPEPMV